MLIEFWKVVPSEQLVRESNLIYMLIRVEKWYLLMNRMPALVWLGISVKVFTRLHTVRRLGKRASRNPLQQRSLSVCGLLCSSQVC